MILEKDICESLMNLIKGSRREKWSVKELFESNSMHSEGSQAICCSRVIYCPWHIWYSSTCYTTYGINYKIATHVSVIFILVVLKLFQIKSFFISKCFACWALFPSHWWIYFIEKISKTDNSVLMMSSLMTHQTNSDYSKKYSSLSQYLFFCCTTR